MVFIFLLLLFFLPLPFFRIKCLKYFALVNLFFLFFCQIWLYERRLWKKIRFDRNGSNFLKFSFKGSTQSYEINLLFAKACEFILKRKGYFLAAVFSRNVMFLSFAHFQKTQTNNVFSTVNSLAFRVSRLRRKLKEPNWLNCLKPEFNK